MTFSHPDRMSKISTLSLFFLLLSFFLPVCTAHASSVTDDLQSNRLKVPVNQFVGSLMTTLDIIRDVTSIISNFGNVFGDNRLTNAITDCLDLLDFSADELSWSMSASQNPNGKEQHPLLCIQSWVCLFIFVLHNAKRVVGFQLVSTKSLFRHGR